MINWKIERDAKLELPRFGVTITYRMPNTLDEALELETAFGKDWVAKRIARIHSWEGFVEAGPDGSERPVPCTPVTVELAMCGIPGFANALITAFKALGLGFTNRPKSEAPLNDGGAASESTEPTKQE